MAKKPAAGVAGTAAPVAATAPVAVAFKEGDIVIFKKYAEPPQDGVENFKPGDRVKITAIARDEQGNDTFTCAPEKGTGQGDTLFADEIEPVPAARTRGAAKAKPPALTAEQKAEAKAAKAAEKAAAKAARDAAKPPKLTPEEKEAQALASMTVSKSVAAALKGTSALEAAKKLAARAEETDYALGGVLAHVKRDGLWKQAGYPESGGEEGFGAYTQAELGIAYRKATYLIKTYLTLSALKVDEKKLDQIGWSKAKTIATVATAENLNSLIDFAGSNTRDALEAHIKTTYMSSGSGGSGPKAVLKSYRFRAVEANAKVIDKVIANAKKEIGVVDGKVPDDNTAINYVMMQYAQMVEGVSVTQEQAIAGIEAKYGIKITAEKVVGTGRRGAAK